MDHGGRPPFNLQHFCRLGPVPSWSRAVEEGSVRSRCPASAANSCSGLRVAGGLQQGGGRPATEDLMIEGLELGMTETSD